MKEFQKIQFVTSNKILYIPAPDWHSVHPGTGVSSFISLHRSDILYTPEPECHPVYPGTGVPSCISRHRSAILYIPAPEWHSVYPGTGLPSSGRILEQNNKCPTCYSWNRIALCCKKLLENVISVPKHVGVWHMSCSVLNEVLIF